MDENLIDELNKDITTLSVINDKLENVPQVVQEAKIDSPVSSVENSLSKFFNDAITTSIKDFEFNNKIQEEIAARLPTFNNAELITLLTNNKTGDNDRLTKILGPSFQLMTAKQQAEIAALAQANKNGGDVTINNNISSAKELNATATKDVLKGLQQLHNMLTLAANKDKAVDVDASAHDDKN